MSSHVVDATTIESVAKLLCGNTEYGGSVPIHANSNPSSYPVPRPYLQKWQIGELLTKWQFTDEDDSKRRRVESDEKKESKLRFAERCITELCFEGGSLDYTSLKFQQLLIKLCDFRSYTPEQDGMAELVRQYLNETLSFDGVSIALQGKRPEILLPQSRSEENSRSSFPVIPETVSRLVPLEIYEELSSRWQEAALCYEAGAYRAAILLLGGVFEAVLRMVALKKPDAFKAYIPAKGNPKPPVDWEFPQLLSASAKIGLFDEANSKYADGIRMLGNLVHPLGSGGALQRSTVKNVTVRMTTVAVEALALDAEQFLSA